MRKGMSVGLMMRREGNDAGNDAGDEVVTGRTGKSVDGVPVDGHAHLDGVSL
jgi:hypothetical protein